MRFSLLQSKALEARHSRTLESTGDPLGAESLEQLRWLEAGYTIWVGEAAGDSIGVDTPADLADAERRLKETERRRKKEVLA